MNRVQSELQQAYKLSKNLYRIEDYPPEWREEWGTVDAKVIGELASQDSFNMVFYDPEPIDSFNEIRMEGLMYYFEGVDYLYTEPLLPIMSKRMLSALRSVGDFPHQVIPVTIEDIEVISESFPESSGRVSTDYVAVQLLEHLDIFDHEKSVYRQSSISPNGVGRIKKLVLQISGKGLPPIFRIIENSTYLYVSPEAKAALEEAEITGIRFVDINY